LGSVQGIALIPIARDWAIRATFAIGVSAVTGRSIIRFIFEDGSLHDCSSTDWQQIAAEASFCPSEYLERVWDDPPTYAKLMLIKANEISAGHFTMTPSGLKRVARVETITLKRTGLSSPADAHLGDWIVLANGREVGRIYEVRGGPPEYAWVWSVSAYVEPARGIVTSGRVPSLEAAKAAFLANWQAAEG
jgi:hypothetical protein